MAESQVTPQEIPQQEQSQPLPPRQLGQPERNPLENNDQQRQRVEQVRRRAQAEKKNPFSPENRAARRAEALKSLRVERGVAEPRIKEAPSNEAAREGASDSDVRGRTSEPAGEHGDGTPPAHKDVASDKPLQNAEPPKADEVPEWYKRQEELKAAERRASQASADAERQRAELEKAKADADAAVARMAAAKDDPVQFLAEAGMTKEEWDSFMAHGGRMTPEQKRLKEMAANMQKMQERLEAAEKRAQQQEAQARAAAEESHFVPELQKFTYVPEMGGVAAVRARQRLLSQKTGQPVSLGDAAQHLEQEMATGLQRLLQNPKIRSSLNLDVNTSHAGQAAETPRTLSNRVASESSQADAQPHPLDWAAKKRLYLQRVERERSAQTGR